MGVVEIGFSAQWLENCRKVVKGEVIYRVTVPSGETDISLLVWECVVSASASGVVVDVDKGVSVRTMHDVAGLDDVSYVVDGVRVHGRHTVSEPFGFYLSRE